jgi:hypothetical protein
LVLLNTPLVLAGLINAVVAYKLGRVGKRRFWFRIAFWVGISAGLIFSQPLYAFLFSHGLTQTEPLSLFDVMQITGIVLTLFVATQAWSRIDLLERRVQQLHQELSIRLSDKGKD